MADLTDAELDAVREAAHRTFTGLEPLVADAAQAALNRLADQIAAELATGGGQITADLTADIGGVLGWIRRWWRNLIPDLLLAILAIYEASAQAMFAAHDEPAPPEFTDLVVKYIDDPVSVPDLVDTYLRQATNRLALVGDSLWHAARQALADGEAAGETLDELTARLREVFDDHGHQLGGVRARRIARTETVAAWNRAALDAARAVPEEVRATTKTWLATLDTRTRDAHWRMDRRTVPLDNAFTVAGVPMQYPGDPTAPANLTVNCRCALTFDDDDEHGDAGRQFLTDEQIAEVISHYQEQGIVRESQASATPPATAPQHSGPEPASTPTAGAATAAPPAGEAGAPGGEVTAAGEHTGAMIALVPSTDDIERLTLDDGEPADELHATLYYLGTAADFSATAREHLIDLVASYTRHLPPVEGDAFAASAFNPGAASEQDTALVLGMSGEPLAAVHAAVHAAVEAFAAADNYGVDLPAQYRPWIPHVTLAYSNDLNRLAEVAERVGPIRFTAVRCAFGGEVTDIPLTGPDDQEQEEEDEVVAAAPEPRRWSTPGDTALAYEDLQTGDGRVFAPGSLFWEDGPWPLQYAEQMLGGHEGAKLAGAIEMIERDGDRIAGAGVLYADLDAGEEAIGLLERGAPLGVSVDLDDVDIEVIDRRPAEDHDGDEGAEGEVVLLASLARASFLRLQDGTWSVRGTQHVEWATNAGGAVSPEGLAAALTAAGLPAQRAHVTAAAGDRDAPDGELLMAEKSGDLLMRVTRGRVRGATLVAVPAYHLARIVLDDADSTARQDTTRAEVGVAASACDCDSAETLRQVVEFVSSQAIPVPASYVAAELTMPLARARGYLARAAASGRVSRATPGRYTAPTSTPTAVTAAASGDLDLPVQPDRDAAWDGDAAASRVLAWATGEDGTVDADRLGRAFLYRDPERDSATLAAYKLGFADVRDDTLVIVARGVFAAAAALQGARGGVDVPDTERDELRDRVEDLYERLADAYDDPTLTAPWDNDNDNDNGHDDDDDDGEGARMRELEASAWTAMRQAPPMPAAWFAEPTPEELPPGSGGVHYADGRIYGWVAQAGEPHAGFPGRNLTLESLGAIDLTHFLRAQFQLDDGSVVRAGAFTMNVGHHRDGAECETASCQFDDTRTVAGIVTVGLNARGMWFSGAAAPWLAEWDRQVFNACQPSYHMRQGRDGRWQLRAVLTVPVPGHSSPLVASAVAERANLALAASAAHPAPEPTAAPAPVAGVPAAGDRPKADTGHPAAPSALAVPGVDITALAAALAPALVPALAPAVADELEQRDRIRAEVEALTASLNPVRAEVARSMADRITADHAPNDHAPNDHAPNDRVPADQTA